MEIVEAQVLISLLYRLAFAVNEDGSEAKTNLETREWGKCGLSRARVIWVCGLVLWARKGWKKAPGSAWDTFHFGLLSKILCNRRFSFESYRSYKSYSFSEGSIHTNDIDDKYICNYSHTPVWLMHLLLLGCFHVKFFIIMTFQFGILKFHLCPFSSVKFQWLRYPTSKLC